MTTSKYNDHALTKIDIKALRQCSDIEIDLYTTPGTDYSQIRAIKRNDDNNPWGFPDYIVPVNATLTVYEGYSDNARDYTYECYHYIGSAQFCDTWQTIAGLLREGDILTVDWTTQKPGNKNGGYSGNAMCTLDGYYGLMLWRDDVDLTIKRDNGKRLTFHLSTSFCPDNSAKTVKLYRA